MNDKTVTITMTVQEAQLCRLAIGIAMNDAQQDLDSKNPTDKYMLEELLKSYKAVEQKIYEAQLAMLRNK